MTYTEQLKSPKWQIKRLEILKRDKFTCTSCGEKEKQLHVHHGYYDKGLMLWDYEDDTLHTLCSSCHEIAHDDLFQIKIMLATLNTNKLKYAIDVLGQVFYPINKEQSKENLNYFFDLINKESDD
jgi:hypothetical protein